MANSCVSSGNADLRVGQDEGEGLAVEREAVRAVADGEHEHRGRPVDREAGGDLLAARLQEALLVGSQCCRRRLGQRSTEKMVPTEMLTSMFEEPSSGSNSSRYSPRG